MDKLNIEWAKAEREADEADLQAKATSARLEYQSLRFHRLVQVIKLLHNGDHDAAHDVLTELDN